MAIKRAALLDVVRTVEKGLLVHGHLHGRMQRAVPTRAGSILSIGATSASLHHDDEHRMAGFNVYEFDGGGALTDVAAHVFEPATESFRIDSVPSAFRTSSRGSLSSITSATATRWVPAGSSVFQTDLKAGAPPFWPSGAA